MRAAIALLCSLWLGVALAEGVGAGMSMPMSAHMHMTELRAARPEDAQRAGVVAAAARAALLPYEDYHRALADGYQIFLPNLPQRIYHFTKRAHALEALVHFDPSKPTSLLYRKGAGGDFELIGAMYTDRVTASEEELDARVPLSVARWHQHVNFCRAPPEQRAAYFGPDAKFGLLGSISTRAPCEAAGGRFYPHVFGWMVHVYPFEQDPARIWAVDDRGDGHDNMDHSAMPGMKMESP